MSNWYSWLAVATGLGLLPRWNALGEVAEARHRPADPTGSTESGRRPSVRTLSVVTALLAAIAAVLLGAMYAALPVAVLAGFAVRMLSRSRAPAGPDPRSVALVLDLLAATLAAGAPPEHAIAEVAIAVEAHGSAGMRAATAPLQLVGRLLRLGSDPITAWSGLDSVAGLAQVGLAGRRCAHSGARLANALADTAGDLRAEHQAASISRAQRTGVWTLLPLGCCFLPAFICLGVLPVVLGVAGQVLGNA